jgi:hypothetical protein
MFMRNLKMIFVLLSFNAFITGCFSLGGEKKDMSGSSNGLSDADVAGSGILTASIPTSTQIMPHLISVTGLSLAQVTANTRNSFAAKVGLLSLNGDADSISGPVQLATLSLGGEFCDDILDVEVPMAAAQRRYYMNVNFGAGLNSLSSATRAEVMGVMARRFWGREADAAELSLLQNGLTDAFGASSQTATAETRRMMFYLCTVMLSSSSAHLM